MGVKFYPIQEGTGDPSPTNVRPITAPLTITGIGEIYGGTFDARTGVLTEEWVKGEINQCQKTGTWDGTKGAIFYTTISTLNLPQKKASSGVGMCDRLAPMGGLGTSNTEQGIAIYDNGIIRWIYYDYMEYTATEYTEVLEDDPIIIAYQRANPITHTLTPSQYAEVVAQLNLPAISKELLMRRRNLGAPHTATATGAVATFAGNMVAPLKECKCEFTPVQSGSGDPSPSNVRPISGWTGANISRTGKNLCPNKMYQNNTGAIYIGQDNGTDFPLMLVGGVQYTLSYNTVTTGSPTAYLREKNDSSGTAIGSGTAISFTPSKTGNYRIALLLSGMTTGDISNVQIEKGSPATTYTSYAGNTYPVQFPATKNLWNGTLTNNGYIQFSVTAGQTYTATAKRIDTSVSTYLYLAKRATGDTGSWENVGKPIQNNVLNVVTFTAEAGYDYALWSNSSYTNVTEVQIEKGSSATAYEPYGTIYGGYIDPVRGVAVAEYICAQLTGTALSADWPAQTDTMGFYRSTGWSTATGLPAPVDGDNGIFDYCKIGAVYLENTPWVARFFWNGGSFNRFEIRLPLSVLSEANLTGAKAYLNAHPLTVCYKIAPIEYPLTPQLIKSLKGQNNVFSDLNGNTTVKYWKH